MKVPFFQLVAFTLPSQQLVEVPQILLQILGMGNRLKITLQQFGPGVAHNVTQALVDVQPTAIDRNMGNSYRGILKGTAEARFALLQGHFCGLALSDIKSRRHQKGNDALFVDDGGKHKVDNNKAIRTKPNLDIIAAGLASRSRNNRRTQLRLDRR